MTTESKTISRHDLEAMFRPETLADQQLAALERLIDIAKRDTGQSRHVACFLLAWWNADTCGGFDLTDTWAVDRAIAEDMVIVFGMVARVHSYPNSGPHDYEDDFAEIIEQWRPQLVSGKPSPD